MLNSTKDKRTHLPADPAQGRTTGRGRGNCVPGSLALFLGLRTHHNGDTPSGVETDPNLWSKSLFIPDRSFRLAVEAQTKGGMRTSPRLFAITLRRGPTFRYH